MLSDLKHVFKVGPSCVVRDCMSYCAKHNQHA